MINYRTTKKITIDMGVTAPTNGVYAIVKEEKTGFLLDATDNRFRAVSVAPYILLVEDTQLLGNFNLTIPTFSIENMHVPDLPEKWEGTYNIKAFIQTDVAPNPVADLVGSKTVTRIFRNDLTIEDRSGVPISEFVFQENARSVPFFGASIIESVYPHRARVKFRPDGQDAESDSIAPAIVKGRTVYGDYLQAQPPINSTYQETTLTSGYTTLFDVIDNRILTSTGTGDVGISKKPISDPTELLTYGPQHIKILTGVQVTGNSSYGVANMTQAIFSFKDELFYLNNGIISMFNRLTDAFDISVLDMTTLGLPITNQGMYYLKTRNKMLFFFHNFDQTNEPDIHRAYLFDGTSFERFFTFKCFNGVDYTTIPSSYRSSGINGANGEEFSESEFLYMLAPILPFVQTYFDLNSIVSPTDIMEMTWSQDLTEKCTYFETNNSQNTLQVGRLLNTETNEYISTYRHSTFFGADTISYMTMAKFEPVQTSSMLYLRDFDLNFMYGRNNTNTALIFASTASSPSYVTGYNLAVNVDTNEFLDPRGNLSAGASCMVYVLDEVNPLKATNTLTSTLSKTASLISIAPSSLKVNIGTVTGNLNNIKAIDGSYVSIVEVGVEPGIQGICTINIPMDFNLDEVTLNLIGTYDGWDTAQDHHIDVKAYDWVNEIYSYTTTEIEIESLDTSIVYRSKVDKKFISPEGRLLVKFEHDRVNGAPLQPGHEFKLEKIEAIMNKVSGGENIQTEFWA